MVQFDDFGGLEEAARPAAAKCIDSTAPIAKFGRDEHGDIGLGGQPLLDLADALVGESGGADDRVDSVVDQELQVVHHDVGMGEVDDDLGAGVDQLTQRIAGVDPGGERQVRGVHDAWTIVAPTLPLAPSTPTRMGQP